MRRLIYTSRPSTEFDTGALASILAASKVRNDHDGITGMLWFGGETFAQVLEGDAAAVGETMLRIYRDPRHCVIRTIEDRAITSRLFGNWGMIRADGDELSIANTAYLVGFCVQKNTGEARGLANFLLDHG